MGMAPNTCCSRVSQRAASRGLDLSVDGQTCKCNQRDRM